MKIVHGKIISSSWAPNKTSKPGHAPAAGQCSPGFLKCFCICVRVCMCGCLPSRLLVASVVMWHDMDLI